MSDQGTGGGGPSVRWFNHWQQHRCDVCRNQKGGVVIRLALGKPGHQGGAANQHDALCHGLNMVNHPVRSLQGGLKTRFHWVVALHCLGNAWMVVVCRW